MIAERVVKNTGFLYLRMLISTGILLYTVRLVVQGLGTEDFGLFNIVGGVLAMLAFLNASMAMATQRYMNYSEGADDFMAKRRVFNNSILLHLLTAVISLVLFAIVGLVVFNGVLNISPNRVFASQVVYGCLVISTFFTVLGVPYDAAINAHENMKFYAIVGVVESLLKLIIALVTIRFAGDRLIFYGILMSLVPICSLAMMMLYCHRHYRECSLHLRSDFEKPLFRELAGFAGWNMLGIASSLFGNYGQGIVLNHFFGAVLNAAQGIATQVVGQLMAFSRNMLKALNPVLAKSEGRGDRATMLLASLKGNKYSFYILAFFSLPCIIEMPYILEIWLDEVPQWAVVFSQLHLVRTLIEQVTISFNSSIAAEGRVARFNQMICLINLSSIPVTVLLFLFGSAPVAMYWANILIYGVLFSAVEIYFMKRQCQMSLLSYFREVLLPAVRVSAIVSLLGCVPLLFMPAGFVRLLAVCGLCGVSTLALIFFDMDGGERHLLRHLTEQRVQKRREP